MTRTIEGEPKHTHTRTNRSERKKYKQNMRLKNGTRINASETSSIHQIWWSICDMIVLLRVSSLPTDLNFVHGIYSFPRVCIDRLLLLRGQLGQRGQTERICIRRIFGTHFGMKNERIGSWNREKQQNNKQTEERPD